MLRKPWPDKAPQAGMEVEAEQSPYDSIAGAVRAPASNASIAARAARVRAGRAGPGNRAAAEGDAIMPNDPMQQRIALMGGIDAAEVFQNDRALQEQVRRIAARAARAQQDGEQGTEAAPDVAVSAQEHFELFRQEFLRWGESVLFREGSGSAALARLAAREAWIVERDERAGDEPASIRDDVAHVRAQHVARFAPTRAALQARFLAGLSRPHTSSSPHRERDPSAPGAQERLSPLDAQAVPADVSRQHLHGRGPGVDADVVGAVTPNSRAQQRVALVGAATALEVFELDAGFRDLVRQVATIHADTEARERMDRDAREAATRVGEAHEGTFHAGSALDPALAEEEDMAAEAAVEAAYGASADQRYAELRAQFIKWGGRVIFERSTGGRALARLAREEKQLVARLQRTDPQSLPREIVLLRRRHARDFEATLEEIKHKFLQTAALRLRFLHEPQRGVRRNHRMRRLPDAAEGAKKIRDLDGLIEAGTHGQELEVADSAVAFAEELKASAASGVSISTYAGHSWGRYSLDIFPRIAIDPQRGFYDTDEMVRFFMTIEEVAQRTGMRWRALYTTSRWPGASTRRLDSGAWGSSGSTGPRPTSSMSIWI